MYSVSICWDERAMDVDEGKEGEGSCTCGGKDEPARDYKEVKDDGWYEIW